MNIKKILSPLYLLSYRKQVVLRDIALFILKFLPMGKNINYRNYNIKLLRDDKSANLIYLGYLIHGNWGHEIFEQQVLDSFIYRNRKSNIFFIDVGASYGMFTFLASRHANVSSIVSIEAYKPVYECLLKNLENNSIKNVRLLNMVVSDSNDDFYDVQEFSNSEWNQFNKCQNSKGGLKSITLDRIIERYKCKDQRLILIKMDIEGNEPNALKGLVENIDINININIMLEFHVGVLEEIDGQAFKLAELLLSFEKSTVFIMDVGRKKLIPVKSLDNFNRKILEMKKANFPFNLFNIFVVNNENIEILNDFIGENL